MPISMTLPNGENLGAPYSSGIIFVANDACWGGNGI